MVVEAEYQSVPFKVAVADHCRGLVTGDPAPALSAAEYYLASGRPLFRAPTLEDAAALEAERGELAAAERYLGETLAIYTRRWVLRGMSSTLATLRDRARAGRVPRPRGGRR